jgi:hypothetical protein
MAAEAAARKRGRGRKSDYDGDYDSDGDGERRGEYPITNSQRPLEKKGRREEGKKEEIHSTM